MDLKNKRILLRPFLVDDWLFIDALLNKAETVRYNPSGYPGNASVTKDLVKQWADQQLDTHRREFTFMITDILDASNIGVISLNLGKEKYKNAEVWFKLDPAKWGRGYATESLKTIIDFGFKKLNLHRIEAGCSVKNIASYCVMEKAGMKREGINIALLPLEDGWHDAYFYGILNSQH